MKNIIQLIIATMTLTLGLSYAANAQVTAQKIGTNPTTIAPSAVLDVESANKGVLFPRVALTSTTDVTTIASPATALTIYNTATAGIAPNTVTPGYYYWNGTKWTKLATETEASKWSYDAINSRINLTNLSNGTTARSGATGFRVTDDNVLQIGDMTDVPVPAWPERGIIARKTGNASITNISDGGIYSIFENQIYGGFTGGNAVSSAAYNVFAKSRGSLASPQAVQDGDLVSVFEFRGNSGTGLINSARLLTRVEGAVASNSVPISFDFHTVGPTQTVPSSRLKISSNGNVGIGATSPANKLEITQGTAGNSGLRFTNLTSASAATTTASKVLGLNSSGDVILTNVPGTQNIVAFSTATPTTSGVLFTPNTPTDQSVVYQSSTDNSLWTYNGTAYVTYTAPATTPFFLANTTNDAGGNKTSNIYRTGNVGIGTASPSFSLDVQGSNAGINLVRSGGNDAFFRLNSSANNTTITQIRSTPTGNLNFTTNDVATRMTITQAGNIGIGATAPATTLEVQHPLLATASINANAQVLRLSRFGTSGSKWDNIAQFNLGSFSANAAADTRLDLVLNNNNTTLNTTPTMTWQANGNVGINTSTPRAALEVNGSLQVNGAATNVVAFNNGAANAIAFSASNLAYTTLSPQMFALTGMKDGGTYTLAVQGGTAGTSTFMAPGLNFRYVNNEISIANTHTLYTFIVMGTTVYVYTTIGFTP